MSGVRIEIHRSEVGRLLKGQGRYSGVRKDLERRANNIANQAGDGHEVKSSIGRNRARATVGTSDFDAILAQSRDGNLTAALDAGRQ